MLFEGVLDNPKECLATLKLRVLRLRSQHHLKKITRMKSFVSLGQNNENCHLAL